MSLHSFISILLTCLCLTAGMACAAEGEQVLKHIVMYKFRDDLTPQQLQEVLDAFAALPTKIDSVIGLERGKNVSQEGKSEGLTHCFVVTFKDEAGLKIYLEHPAHTEYVTLARPRREKVIVFDYWAPAGKK